MLAHELAPEFVGLPQVHEVRTVPGADSSYWTWDLAVTRHLRGRWSLTAGVHANPAQNINWSSGPAFLAPLTIVPPRIARLGMTWEW